MRLSISYNQRGFSLPELMVALTIGLLVTLAISTLFVSTRQDYKQNDSTAKMEENARFALEILSSDLRHAGFVGTIPSPGDVDVDYMSPATPSVDCGPATPSGKPGLYNLTSSHLVMSFGNQIANAATNAFYGTCLDASDNVKPNSSILLVKRVAAQPTPPLLHDDPTTPGDDTTMEKRITGMPYIYTNGGDAYLYTYPPTTALPMTNGEHWEYQPRIYFITNEDTITPNGLLDAGEDANGNGTLEIDTLYRKSLVSGGAAPTLQAEPLVNGIQAFHIEFGVDTMPADRYDGTPGYFYTPNVDADPAAATDLDNAVSATIYVLARTTETDPDTKYSDNKVYKLGSTGPQLGPFNDRFHRRVYSTTVMLKNIRNQVMSR